MPRGLPGAAPSPAAFVCVPVGSGPSPPPAARCCAPSAWQAPSLHALTLRPLLYSPSFTRVVGGGFHMCSHLQAAAAPDGSSSASIARRDASVDSVGSYLPPPKLRAPQGPVACLCFLLNAERPSEHVSRTEVRGSCEARALVLTQTNILLCLQSHQTCARLG